MLEQMTQPCKFCPYRRDVPSGVWSRDEYEKLRDYDKPTAEQPLVGFCCHNKPECYCAGWLAVSLSQPHSRFPIALRIASAIDGFVPNDMSIDGFFENHTKACDHGLEDIDDPSEEAFTAMDSLEKVLERRTE